MSIGQVASGTIKLLTSNPSLTTATSLLFVLLYSGFVYFIRKPTSKNPLQVDNMRSPEPCVHDTKRRDVVLKDRYKPAKVPDNLDAIIIGSGAGGLSAGALLAKAGKKVLVLEQHDQAGGCCHSFVEKGFEFDTGIHYIGSMQEGELYRVLLDQLTCGQLRWARMDDVFDTVVFGKPTNPKLFPMKAGSGEFYYENLIKLFPHEKTAILAYRDLVEDAAGSIKECFLLKMLPHKLVNIMVTTGLYRLFLKAYRKRYATKPLQEVLDGLTDNKELKLVLSYICGDCGCCPETMPFIIHAVLVHHYKHGAYYPVNGSSEIVYHMIQVIQQAGGKVLVQAPVTDILCDSNGRAIGVRVDGKGEVEIRAKYIISGAGVVNTFKKLLPENVARRSDIYPLIEKVGQSYSFLSFFIGLEGSSSELQLPTGNFWLYSSENIDKSLREYLDTKPEDVDTMDIPFGFISFPSAKDPEWENKFPGKSNILINVPARWEWFEEWKNEKVRHRGDRYEDIKDALGRKMWQTCVDLFPQLDGKKLYMEVGTPVTNYYYMACSQGEMFGLDHKLPRFSAEVVSKLRSETNIEGLYLTGQDIFTCGFMSAVLSGLLCTSKILNRNIFSDLVKLTRDIKKKNAGTKALT